MTNSSYIEHLCMGCMREKDNDDPCRYCGLQEQSYLVAPHQLPLRSILNGKYLVGKVLGEDENMDLLAERHAIERGGRSGRTARQFVESLISKE